MTKSNNNLDDILYAFSVEPKHDLVTLESYLKKYPEFSDDLLDLAHELRVTESYQHLDIQPTSDTWAEKAWEKFVACAPTCETATQGAFEQNLRGQAFVTLAEALAVPRSFLIAFRDRLVVPTSIPQSFIARLAEATQASIQTVQAYMSLPPQVAGAVQFKSDDKPQHQGQLTFRELVEKTDMTEDSRQALLRECASDGPQ